MKPIKINSIFWNLSILRKPSCMVSEAAFLTEPLPVSGKSSPVANDSPASLQLLCHAHPVLLNFFTKIQWSVPQSVLSINFKKIIESNIGQLITTMNALSLRCAIIVERWGFSWKNLSRFGSWKSSKNCNIKQCGEIPKMATFVKYFQKVTLAKTPLLLILLIFYVEIH